LELGFGVEDGAWGGAGYSTLNGALTTFAPHFTRLFLYVNLDFVFHAIYFACIPAQAQARGDQGNTVLDMIGGVWAEP